MTARTALRKATLHLTAPVSWNGSDTVTGWISEEGSFGVRIHEQENLKGRQQFFPASVIEKIETIEA